MNTGSVVFLRWVRKLASDSSSLPIDFHVKKLTSYFICYVSTLYLAPYQVDLWHQRRWSAGVWCIPPQPPAELAPSLHWTCPWGREKPEPNCKVKPRPVVLFLVYQLHTFKSIYLVPFFKVFLNQKMFSLKCDAQVRICSDMHKTKWDLQIQ